MASLATPIMAVQIIDPTVPEGAQLHLARGGVMSAICGQERYTNGDVVEPDSDEALKIFTRGAVPGWLAATSAICGVCTERARNGAAL